jgi:hypothetical protein
MSRTRSDLTWFPFVPGQVPGERMHTVCPTVFRHLIVTWLDSLTRLRSMRHSIAVILDALRGQHDHVAEDLARAAGHTPQVRDAVHMHIHPL